MTIGTHLHTLLRGEPVGADSGGNRYYQDKRHPESGARRRRWVLYHGRSEASNVPPDWHAWLHYTIDVPPSVVPLPAQPWEQPHQPNPTGGPNAHMPQGHPAGKGLRPKATGDYEPWKPV